MVGSVCDSVGREVVNCAHVLVLGGSVVLWLEGSEHKVRCMHCDRK